MIRKLMILLFLVFLPINLLADAPDFPPIEGRYEEIPPAVIEVVDKLRGLEAQTEIGVNFIRYDAAVSDAYPAVKVLVESPQTTSLPELRWVLSNAMDCYLKVRELWGQKISGSSPSRK